LCWVRLVEKEDLVKASPEGAIKEPLVVGHARRRGVGRDEWRVKTYFTK
jgi:hypothetical protein